MLKPLLIFIYLWISVFFNFVIKLLSSNYYNLVTIMIDQLINKRYYILYTIDKNNKIAKAIFYLLLNNIYKFYSLSLSLMSNWGH